MNKQKYGTMFLSISSIFHNSSLNFMCLSTVLFIIPYFFFHPTMDQFTLFCMYLYIHILCCVSGHWTSAVAGEHLINIESWQVERV